AECLYEFSTDMRIDIDVDAKAIYVHRVSTTPACSAIVINASEQFQIDFEQPHLLFPECVVIKHNQITACPDSDGFNSAPCICSPLDMQTIKFASMSRVILRINFDGIAVSALAVIAGDTIHD